MPTIRGHPLILFSALQAETPNEKAAHTRFVGYLRVSVGRQRCLLNAIPVAQIHRSLIQKHINAMRIFATAIGNGGPRAVKVSILFWSTSKTPKLAAHTRINKKGESGHQKPGKQFCFVPPILGHPMIVFSRCRLKRPARKQYIHDLWGICVCP